MIIQTPVIRVRRIALLFVVICLLQTRAVAQPANAAFRNITPAEGLPSTSVSDIAQDAFGFIWIASWEGDYRYDGRLFKKIPSTLDGRYLKADKKGGVWISFESSVGYYNPWSDSVTHYKIATTNRFPDIGIDKKGIVWITTSDGILRFDSASHQFRKDAGQQPGSVWNLSAGNAGDLLFIYYQKQSKENLIGHRTSPGIYTYEPFPVDKNNTNKDNRSIAKADGPKGTLDAWETYVFQTDSCWQLFINKYGWAYKTSKNADWVFKKPVSEKMTLAASDAKPDSRGNFWLVQQNALSKINITTGQTTIYKYDPTNPGSILPLTQVLSGCKMFIDRQGILWVASFSNGISRLNLFESDFGLLKNSEFAPVEDVLSALELNDGSYFIGARKLINGLVHYSADGKIIRQFGEVTSNSPPGKSVSTELSHPFAWALAQTADGSIWVGGGMPGKNLGGVSRIRPGTDQITRFKSVPGDTSSLIGDALMSLLVDGSGRLWAMTLNGMSSIDPATEKIKQGIDELPWTKKGIREYFPPFITNSGDLVLTNGDDYKNYIVDHLTTKAKQIAGKITETDSMFVVHQDDANRMWFVSPKGFGFLDSTLSGIANFYQFKKLGFPINEMPWLLNSDKEGNIWLATDNGIIEFDPVTEKYKHFGFERGLQGASFNTVNYKGPSGKIYFGGNGGINIFQPSAINTNPYPPAMVFTNLKLDGESIMPGKNAALQQPIFAADKITIAPGVLTISIDFAAIHFAGANSNRFQYKLEGFDKGWRDGATIGNATYTNLSPGTYTFYIKGANWDGVWSDGRKSIKIIVLPPWWRRWWAYTLYGLIFLFLLWRFFRFQKIRTIRKEREKTQQRELEQAREIEKAYHELKSTQQQLIQSEKMASLGELTAGIAHEIQNPLNFVNNFSEINTDLIAEAALEMDKGNIGEVKTILNDIKENEQKINHHGKRADAIVKGMLQHSRTSTGQKEPTDINALVDEYLRLAYHGLRARDKTFNSTLQTDFDKSIGKLDIVPQDMGRVVLNLINNAFYAASLTSQGGFSDSDRNKNPTVWVSTRKVDGKVEIRVKDNGPGIPQKILDKIFQPFFTTKPTGQGTGLGLSLAYDIVKAHGGEIKVETREGEGSEFMILLPVKINE